MPPFDEGNLDFPPRFVWNPIPKGDWIDMPFVLREIEGELRNEVLGIALETMANVHQSIADGTRRVANAIQGARE
jgi:hypothetical protein